MQKGEVCPEVSLSGTADIAGVVVPLLQSPSLGRGILTWLTADGLAQFLR